MFKQQQQQQQQNQSRELKSIADRQCSLEGCPARTLFTEFVVILWARAKAPSVALAVDHFITVRLYG